MENNRPLGWTRLDEAKRLVEAGLDPNTADMCYQIMGNNGDRTYVSSALTFNTEDDNIPCWSLGALINMMPKWIPQDREIIRCGLNLHIMSEENNYDYALAYQVYHFSTFPTVIEAAVDMVLFLIQKGYIKKIEL